MNLSEVLGVEADSRQTGPSLIKMGFHTGVCVFE